MRIEGTDDPAPRIGSLCSGYGGLDLAVASVLGGTVAWHSDTDPAASRILNHHWPHTPNLGDLTAVDWAAVEPVDILTAGYPCQPFSVAGHRKGLDDARHLWPWIASAVRLLRPRLCVFENVAGHLRLGFDTVLADLAALGMDARWGVIRAADVGAPHRRDRLFIVAHPADTGCARPQRKGQTAQAGWHGSTERRGGTLTLPTPSASDGMGGPGHSGRAGGLNLRTAVTLLPTPAVNDMGEGKTPAAWDAWTDTMRARHGSGNGHGASLAIEAQRLLPTPSAMAPDAKVSERAKALYSSSDRLADIIEQDRWGYYAPAIARWEHILGREAPAPTINGRLSPGFVEWMMGLPAGHVTDPAIGLSRPQQLKALGNGVVPSQAGHALRLLLGC